MSLIPTRWLIELCIAFRPVGQYLQVFDDGDLAWTADTTLATRFATKADAERFGRNRMMHDFVASEHAQAAIQRRPARNPMVGEVEDLVGL